MKIEQLRKYQPLAIKCNVSSEFEKKIRRELVADYLRKSIKEIETELEILDITLQKAPRDNDMLRRCIHRNMQTLREILWLKKLGTIRNSGKYALRDFYYYLRKRRDNA